jgi:hypothetical protein
MGVLQQRDLISYFLRVAPDFGLEVVRKAMRTDAQVLSEAVEESMSAEFEKLSLDSLDDDNPHMVLSAVQVLCKHGAAANKPKIRAAIMRVINRWREAKVDPETTTLATVITRILCRVAPAHLCDGHSVGDDP